GAVPTQAMIEPFGFPAELVIVQEVGLVRRKTRATIDAARAEALGPDRIKHLVVVDLVGNVCLAERVAFLRGLIHFDAGRIPERRLQETLGLALRTAVARREAVEAEQTVLGMEVASTQRAAPLVGEVKRHLAEYRRVVIVARLFGQPQQARMAGNAQIVGQIVD